MNVSQVTTTLVACPAPAANVTESIFFADLSSAFFYSVNRINSTIFSLTLFSRNHSMIFYPIENKASLGQVNSTCALDSDFQSLCQSPGQQ